jgi:putative ABC transport system permease protein
MSRSAFGYTTGLSILTGLLFAILPAAQTAQSRLRLALISGRGATVAERRVHARGVLIVAEVALAVVLLIGSGLMVRTFQELRSVDPGFDPEGVVTFTLTLPPARYPDSESEVQFFERLLERVRALPGVEAAGAISTLPMRPMPAYTVGIEDFPTEPDAFPPTIGHGWATPGYLEAMRIPLRSGRGLDSADEVGEPRTILVSEAVQEEYWPTASALGKVIATFGERGEVAGVVGDVRIYSLDRPPEPVMYLPLNWQRTPTWRPMSVAVRTAGDPSDVVPALREEVASVDPALPLSDIATMEDVVRESMSETTFTMFLLVVAALVSVFLGAVGVYGVISYVVSQRTSEFGVRAALGATSFDITAGVLRRGLVLAALGVASGLGAASLLGGVLESFLFDVPALDLLTFAVGGALFLLVAASACIVPARRAANVDPATALRT